MEFNIDIWAFSVVISSRGNILFSNIHISWIDVKKGDKMNTFTNEQVSKYGEWARSFSDLEVVNNILILERLLDTDDMSDSLLVDIAIDLVDVLKDECVRRVSLKYVRKVGLDG